MRPDPLSPKERRFVAEYLKDQNGNKAAIRAGYSERSARTIAARLLAKDNIAAAVTRRIEKVEEKSELTALRVRSIVLQLLTFDPRDAFNADGTTKKIHEMPDDVAMAIAGIESDDASGRVTKFRFSDRARSAELAAKILGMLKLELTGKGGEPIQVQHQRESIIDGLTESKIDTLLEGINAIRRSRAA